MSWNFFFFFINNCLPLGLLKECPTYRRSLQPSNKTSSSFKNEIYNFFTIFVGYFCPLESGSGFGSATLDKPCSLLFTRCFLWQVWEGDGEPSVQLLSLHSGPVPVLTLARSCTGPQTPGLQVSCVYGIPGTSNSSLCTLVQFLKLQAYWYLIYTSNSSRCTLVQFQFSLWPDHVRYGSSNSRPTGIMCVRFLLATPPSALVQFQF
jgi:hypothetical protein